MIDMVLRQEPEIFTDASGAEIARRYDVGDYLAGVVGANWDKIVTTLIDTQGMPLSRDLVHESVKPIGYGTHESFEITAVGGAALVDKALGFRRAYGDFGLLMSAAMDESGLDSRNMKYYVHPDDMFSPVYRQQPQPSTSEVSYTMEGHEDARWSGVLAVDVPDEGGELVFVGRQGELVHIGHRNGTFVCVPHGRDVTHYTMPVAQKRDVIALNYPDIHETDEQRESATALSLQTE